MACEVVGELLAGRDEAARAREVAEVGAVVVGRVADAVRVDGERLLEAGSSALRKWTTSVSPTSASSVGPGIDAGPAGLAKPVVIAW